MSLESDLQSSSTRSSVVTSGDEDDRNSENAVVPLQALDSESSEDSAYRVKSFASSLESSISRVGTIRRAITDHVKDEVSNIQDDARVQQAEKLERKKTRLGREMSNLGLEQAIRIATYKTENEGVPLEKEESIAKLEQVVTGTEKTEAKNIPPPDTGYAWVMAGAGALLLFCTWGSNGAYGVFLSYWLNHNSFPGAAAKDYALIGSMVLCLAQSLAPFTQMLSAIVGIKPVMIAGIILHFLGYLLASWSTKLWQLYLTHGLLLGLGFALVFNPPNSLIPEWFDKKRGVSEGIVVCATGIGGVVFSLSSQALIEKTGSFRWSLRMIGIVCGFLEILITILTKTRVPKQRLRSIKEIRTRASVMFNFKVAKIWYLHSITVWFLLTLGCYIISLFSLSSYCTFLGFSQKIGSDMTAVYNGCQAIGRFFIGLTSDYTGRVNLALFLSVVMIVLIFAMWINSFSYVCILFYAILSGLTFGSASTLNQPIVADQISPDLFPSAWSFENFFMGIWALVVEVIALGLRDQGQKRPFIRAQICAGFFATGGLLFLIPIRELKIKLFLKDQLKATNQILDDPKSGISTEERALLEKRRAHYNYMLAPGLRAYFRRLNYPLRV